MRVRKLKLIKCLGLLAAVIIAGPQIARLLTEQQSQSSDKGNGVAPIFILPREVGEQTNSLDADAAKVSRSSLNTFSPSSYQSVRQQAISKSDRKLVRQSVSHLFGKSNNQLVSQSISQPATQPENPPVSQSACLSVCLSACLCVCLLIPRCC